MPQRLPSTSTELLDSCACTRMRTAARLVTRTYDDMLRPADIRASQFAVLAGIDAVHGASIAELSKALCMDRTTLSRNLQPLIAAKLVTLAEEGGGRSKAVRLTRAGELKLRAAIPLWQKAQLLLIGQVGKQPLDNLNRELQALIRTY